jgi:hypothetical protein
MKTLMIPEFPALIGGVVHFGGVGLVAEGIVDVAIIAATGAIATRGMCWTKSAFSGVERCRNKNKMPTMTMTKEVGSRTHGSATKC